MLSLMKKGLGYSNILREAQQKKKKQVNRSQKKDNGEKVRRRN